MEMPCALLVSGSRDLRLGSWPALKPLYQPIDVSFLSEAAVLALIQDPVRGKLEIEPAAAAALSRLSGGHPFYVQYICQNVVFHINQTARRRRVIADDVEAVVDFMVRNPHGHIVETWRALADAGDRAALVSLAHAVRSASDYVPTSRIVAAGRRRGFPVSLDSIEGAMAQLVDRQALLERDTAHRFRFRVDLFRRFVCHRFQTPADLRNPTGIGPEAVPLQESA
jgi:hypothetical protein